MDLHIFWFVVIGILLAGYAFLDGFDLGVGIVFYTFRAMVGLGFLMLGIGLWSLWSRFRGTLYENKWLQRATIAMGPSGFLAVLFGWVTTEFGRKPFTVYGLLRTSESHSPIAAARPHAPQ